MLKFVYIIFIALFKLFCEILYVSEFYLDRSLPKYDHYDFIIIGSGSAGSNLQLKGNVLLLEAGGYGSSFIFNIPIVQPLLLRSDYDYKHVTVSQKQSCKALNDQKSFWPTGKIIAGTTRINNMIYHRCHHSDYENIVDKHEAARYFEKMENEVPTTETSFKSFLSKAFIEGSKELRFDDFSYTNLTQKHGRRVSQFHNYWNKIKNPPEICSNAMVTKVLFDDENPKTAIGVEFLKNEIMHKVYGKKIVLSAGTMGTPKILLHSGIGPKHHLESLNIKIVEDLPVGENLKDHVTTNIDLLLNQTIDIEVGDFFNPIKILKYLWNGKDSPFSLGGSDAMGFAKLNASSDFPDLSFILIPTSFTFDYGLHLRKVINLRDDIWEKYYKQLIGHTSATILPILLHPKSKGSIRLESNNFKDPLLIDPNYFAIKEDIEKLVSGIRIVQKILETPSMKRFGAELIPKSLPGCESYSYDSNDYWECYVRHLTLTMYHPYGTCKLGNYDEQSTVVLKNFQIKNIENLYVVDGSILSHVSANPHAIIAMLAQKFSHDMNKRDGV